MRQLLTALGASQSSEGSEAAWSKQKACCPPAYLLSAPLRSHETWSNTVQPDWAGRVEGRAAKGSGSAEPFHSREHLPLCFSGTEKCNLRPRCALTPVPGTGSPCGKSRAVRGRPLHSGVTQFPVVSGPHLLAVTLDNCLCPSVPQLP